MNTRRTQEAIETSSFFITGGYYEKEERARKRIHGKMERINETDYIGIRFPRASPNLGSVRKEM